MKLTKFFKISFLILFIVFMSLFIATRSGYYEYSNGQKAAYTEEMILKFEQDVAEGKNVNINDYLVDNTKNYNNSVTEFGDMISSIIYDTMDFVLEKSFNAIEKMVK